MKCYILDFRKATVQLAKDTICRVCAQRGSIPLSNKLDGYDIMGALCSITNVSVGIIKLFIYVRQI